VLHQANVGKLQQPAPHPVLQHWAADQQPEQRARRVQQIDAVIKPKDLVDDIAVDSALRYHFFAQAREELLEYLASSGEQPVRVAALWDAFARLVRFGERIAFEDGDLVVVIGQCPSSQEAAYARPDRDCMPAEMRHVAVPFLLGVLQRHDTHVSRPSFNTHSPFARLADAEILGDRGSMAGGRALAGVFEKL